MSLILNVSPVQFEDCEICVGRLPYPHHGHRLLDALRSQHATSHVFRRDGPDSILAISVVPGAPSLGKPEMIPLKKHLGLVAFLVRNALVNEFIALGRRVRNDNPIQLMSSTNLLVRSCAAGILPPDWLAVRPVFEIVVRPVDLSRKGPFLAAFINVRTARIIDRTAAELIADGVSLDGVYVAHRVPRKDSRVAARLKLRGRVKSVDGPRLWLSDFRDGIESVEAADVWPSKELFSTCLSMVFEQRAAEISLALENLRAVWRQGSKRLDCIRKSLRVLANRAHEIVPGIPFTFGPLLEELMPEFPEAKTAPHPVYVFDQSGSKTHTCLNKGLNIYGPYSAHVQMIVPLRICVVCQRSQRGEVDQFLRKFFFHGIQLQPASWGDEGKPITNYFGRSFCAKYGVKDVQYEFFFADNNAIDSYKKAFKEALEKHVPGEPWDLAMVQIEEAFRELPWERNPYLIAKATFLSLQIPVQQFQIETTRKGSSELRFCVDSMGLATYAKLDRIPCLLKANTGGRHELIIGLGCAEIAEGRLAQRERFVGITTVFAADGSYYLPTSRRQSR